MVYLPVVNTKLLKQGFVTMRTNRDVELLDVYSAFYFWGGSPHVLESRDYFLENATDKDRKAMAKLTDNQFISLKWDAPKIFNYKLDNNGNFYLNFKES